VGVPGRDPETHRDVLARILFIYAKLNPCVGYVQGMNEAYAHTHTHTHAQIHTHIQAHTHKHTNVHTHANTHEGIWTHMAA
jgi:hypothetical protein